MKLINLTNSVIVLQHGVRYSASKNELVEVPFNKNTFDAVIVLVGVHNEGLKIVFSKDELNKYYKSINRLPKENILRDSDLQIVDGEVSEEMSVITQKLDDKVVNYLLKEHYSGVTSQVLVESNTELEEDIKTLKENTANLVTKLELKNVENKIVAEVKARESAISKEVSDRKSEISRLESMFSNYVSTEVWNSLQSILTEMNSEIDKLKSELNNLKLNN